jgi:Ner family transcriptional regulator
MPTNIPEHPQIPTTPEARRAWIKYQLQLRGLSLAGLAERQGLSRKTVQKALHSGYPKMERLIAKSLGLTPRQLWPERFDAAGQRLRHGARRGGASV